MKKTVALILAIVMTLSLCACGGGSTATTTDNYDKYAAQYGEVGGLYRDLTVASRMDIQNLEPTAGTGAPKDQFYWNIYECLFDLDENENLYADLAKGYEPAADGSYWDIFLFETITDSQGNAITAEDCVASFDWLVGAGEALKYEDVKSWEAVDTYTFRIYWNEAPKSPDDYEFPLCRTYIFDSQYTGNDFSTQPVGTGNYLVVDFVTGNHLTLWANPKYWAANTSEDVSGRLNLHNASVQMLTYEIISESATAEVALEEGTIDFCNYITQQASINKFKEKYADKYVVDDSHVAGSYFFLEPNMDPSCILANDENLRLAIFYCLNNDVISQLMGTSYVPMKTLGHKGFNDFNVEWENEENYANVSNIELAKEYLAKSGYAGQDLNIVCKTSEIEKNATQSIMAQLLAIGITCHMTSIDNSIWTVQTSDPANFDLMVFEMGGPSLIGSLGLPLGQPNVSEDGSDKWSLNFIRDDELFNLIETAKANETHDDEHVKAVIDYALGHAYIYPIAYSFTCYIYSKDITDLYYREKTETPAAFTYVGQTKLEETAKPVGSDEGEGFDPALAGSYTYSEPPKFGDGMCEFVLTLNADGTYRLDETNGVGEKVYIEGTWTSKDKVVSLSASPVMGDMDRLLVDWVSDMNNPAPVLKVNDDGTFSPVTAADPADYAGVYTYSEKGDFGSKNHDFTLTLNADGTYRLDCNNAVGENIWTEGTFTVDGDGNAALSASPVMGDMDKLLNAGWADADNPAPVFTLNKADGTMVPAGFEAPAASDAPAAPAEASAPVEEPGIVKALTGNMGYEAFVFMEESPFGTFPWYVLKKDGDKTIVVTVNDNIGGEAVWHFENTEEDKGVLTLSGLEEADKALPTMGDQWVDKDNFIQKWQITGAGVIQPANMAETAPAEEAPAEQAAAEEPGIIGGLKANGFECFTYVEESPYGSFTWYIMKSDKMVIVVTPNPNLGTADGLGVWHFTSFTEEKGLLHLEGIEEGDKGLPTIGPGWTDKDNFVMEWQITGPDSVVPVAE